MARDSLELVSARTLDEVIALYGAVHTALERSPSEPGPGWRRGVYPTEAEACAGLEDSSLYLLRDEATRSAAATVILNRDQPAAYADAAWTVDAPPERVMVVHIFMVHPEFRRKGFGERTLIAAQALAKESGCQCMRLDTYAGNDPAKALYERAGYRSAGLIDLGFGQYGLHWYCAYEREM